MDLEQAARAMLNGENLVMPAPFFGDAVVMMAAEDNVHVTEDRIVSALTEFARLGSNDRKAASRHVFAYFQDVWNDIGEDALPPGIAPPPTADKVWDLVQAGPCHVTNDHFGDPDTMVVVMEAECQWEPEHGLMLCWRDGKTLTKVSGYDGHVSNASAYDDDRLSQVVYRAVNPRFQTELDA